jgi:glycosyltransferase involved in cell wall biosynthesis
MAAGKAVVASQIEGFSHIVKDGRTGFLVDPDDPERFADKIYRLLTDRELRLQFGKAGKEEAIRRFSPERIAEKTLQLYQRILNEAKIANCLDGKSEKEACSK